MFTKKIFPVFVFLLVSVLFFSCEKEEEEPLEELEFQVVHVADQYYTCKWNAPNISTFEKYYIVHSPFILGVDDDPKNINYKRRTLDSDQTKDNCNVSVINNNGLPLYFQLFVDIGDRYIRSEVIRFETPKSETIDVAATSAIHYPEKDAIYFVEIGLRGLNYYDYKEKQIKENTEVDFPFRISKTHIGNNGFGEEIYTTNENELIIYDANTLEEKDRFSTNGDIYSVATNDNGLIALSVKNSSNEIQILSRANLTLLNNLVSFNAYNNNRGVAFLSKENNELIEVGGSYSMYFRLDENGIVQEDSYIANPFQPSGFNEIITVSPSENYYIYSGKGEVFDSEMNGIIDLNSLFGNYYSRYLFDKEETYLYAILSNASGNFIDKFSVPNFDWVGRKEFVNGTSLDLFYRDGEIHVATFTDDFYCTYIHALNF